MHNWVAEYTRGQHLFNIQEFKAVSKEDAECMAWDGYMHLADCLTVTVRKLMTAEQNQTSLVERKGLATEKRKGQGFKRMAA
jgi:hypothetical protein